MAKEILAGSTNQTIDVFIQDSSSTTGAGLTGLAYNTSGLTCYYRLGATGSWTQLSLATQTIGGAHSDGGFVEGDATNAPGMYRLDLSDAMVATAGLTKIILKGATNMATCPVEIEVVAVNKYDGVRLGLTALPNAAADGAGGLPISDAGGLDLDAKIGALTFTVAGDVDVNVQTWGGTAISTPPAVALGNVAHGGAAATLTLGNSSAGTGALHIANASGPAVRVSGGSYGMFMSASAGYGVRFSGTVAGGYFLGSTTNADGVIFQSGGGTGDDVALDGDGVIAGYTAQTGDAYAYLGTNLGSLGANATEAGGTGDQFTAIPWNASWDAEVQSEVNDGLMALGLDHLLAASVTGTDVTDNSIIAKLVSKSATADWDDFVNTTDALQAIRDQGDAAWVTATSVTVSDKTGFKLASDGLDLVTTWTVDITGNLSGSVGSVTGAVGSVTGAVGSVTGNVGGNVAGSVGSLATQAKADVNAEVDSAFTTQMADSVPADGTIATREQALYAVLQFLTEGSYSGTTMTVKKVDGSTTLMTFTLDDATNPTSITRAT